ncbi:MAG TPA: FmdB family zinc ribbon protein [Thermoanaerobaculia bacterium]
MPLYEYECSQCRERLEAIQRFTEDPYTICPHCGGALRKMASAPAIQFKGSGFHINDYAKKGSGSTETKSESKSDTAAKSDAAGSKSASSE